jgi:hypothetical protein
MANNKHDVEITSKQVEKPFDGLDHSHPSFGMIKVGRVSGAGRRLFGSDVKVDSLISLQISGASVRQDLGTEWYASENEIIQVYLTPVQYAEMISSPDTSGVPCTIRFSEKLGQIVPRTIDTATEYVQSHIEKQVAELKENVSTASKDLMELLAKKGAFTKDDKKAVEDLFKKTLGDVTSGIPHYEKELYEKIERAKMEAKNQIESHISHAINNAGVAALNNPEIAKLVFDNKDKA